MTDLAPASRMFLAQAAAELRMRWRAPAFSGTSLLLPIVIFTFVGLPLAREHTASGVSVGALILASFGAYAVGSVMVFAFGVGVAAERGMKIDLLMRAMPLPPWVGIGAKVIAATAFAFLSVTLLIAYGILVGGVRAPLGVWLSVTARLLVGSVPLIGLGLAIGYSVGPTAAPAVANLVYLPLAFASGLFMPVNRLPEVVQHLAPVLPTYHYAQLAWGALGAASEPLSRTVVWLSAYSILFLGLALRAYRREESRKFS